MAPVRPVSFILNLTILAENALIFYVTKPGKYMQEVLDTKGNAKLAPITSIPILPSVFKMSAITLLKFY